MSLTSLKENKEEKGIFLIKLLCRKQKHIHNKTMKKFLHLTSKHFQTTVAVSVFKF